MSFQDLYGHRLDLKIGAQLGLDCKEIKLHVYTVQSTSSSKLHWRALRRVFSREGSGDSSQWVPLEVGLRWLKIELAVCVCP